MAAGIPMARKAGYAFGDYGLNLYWQSVSFFLLFFYTDVVGISVAVAGVIYMVASIFDGLIDPLAGAIMDRMSSRWGRYRHWIAIGAVPLALSFALLFWTPLATGAALVLILLLVHMVFRICYTIVAVPLASLSARMTSNSDERTTLAALRMLFGAAAIVTIGFVIQPLTETFGQGDQAWGLFLVALLLGALATVALFVCFAATREPPVDAVSRPRVPLRSYLTSVRHNLAFLFLVAGLLFATLSTTSLNKSLLYYFKYIVDDESAASIALSSGAFISLVLAPFWALLGRRVGKRIMWLVAVGIGLVGLAAFLALRPTTAIGATLFFMWMQTVTVGVQVGYWGTLPDTVEFGQWRVGSRHESFLFGLFMFVQKAGFGLAVALYGFALSAIGFDAATPMDAATRSNIGLVMAALSAIGLLGSGIAVFLSPLRKGVHENVLAELERAEAEAFRDEGAIVR